MRGECGVNFSRFSAPLVGSPGESCVAEKMKSQRDEETKSQKVKESKRRRDKKTKRQRDKKKKGERQKPRKPLEEYGGCAAAVMLPFWSYKSKLLTPNRQHPPSRFIFFK